MVTRECDFRFFKGENKGGMVMAMQTCHVFVQFGVDGINQHGLSYSNEPRKWSAMLLKYEMNPEHIGIDRTITAFGYSEWPLSMNLRVNLNSGCLAQELERLKMLITGCLLINIFVPLADTPPLTGITRQVVRNFERRAA